MNAKALITIGIVIIGAIFLLPALKNLAEGLGGGGAVGGGLGATGGGAGQPLEIKVETPAVSVYNLIPEPSVDYAPSKMTGTGVSEQASGIYRIASWDLGTRTPESRTWISNIQKSLEKGVVEYHPGSQPGKDFTRLTGGELLDKYGTGKKTGASSSSAQAAGGGGDIPQKVQEMAEQQQMTKGTIWVGSTKYEIG